MRGEISARKRDQVGMSKGTTYPECINALRQKGGASIISFKISLLSNLA